MSERDRVAEEVTPRFRGIFTLMIEINSNWSFSGEDNGGYYEVKTN